MFMCRCTGDGDNDLPMVGNTVPNVWVAVAPKEIETSIRNRECSKEHTYVHRTEHRVYAAQKSIINW